MKELKRNLGNVDITRMGNEIPCKLTWKMKTTDKRHKGKQQSGKIDLR